MIATVSDVGGRHDIAGFAVYNATKFAVVGLHDALRQELGPECIRVSLIEFGAVYTNWGYNIPKEEMKATNWGGKIISPQIIGNRPYATRGHISWKPISLRPSTTR